jgi:hypothetical protein
VPYLASLARKWESFFALGLLPIWYSKFYSQTSPAMMIAIVLVGSSVDSPRLTPA